MRRLEDSKLATEYITEHRGVSKNTADTYALRLRRFAEYLDTQNLDIDTAVKKMKMKPEPELDPYSVLSGLKAFMATKNKSPRYEAHVTKTAKTFLDYCGIDISQARFKQRVKLKRIVRTRKYALSKQEVREIIHYCSDNLRLHTYVLFLAVTGARATEALSIKRRDLHLDASPPYVEIRGENTKTKEDRRQYLTAELASELRRWDTEKYRERKLKYDYSNKEKPEVTYEKFKPQATDNDYVFMVYHHDGQKNPTIDSLYVTLEMMFGERLDRMGKGQREHNNNRRQITFHSFRRFVKTEISKLGLAGYSEGYIGHATSTYWQAPAAEQIALFRKVEPYLTFLDVAQLEAKGVDQQTRLDQMQFELQKEREERAKLYELLYKQGIIKKE